VRFLEPAIQNQHNAFPRGLGHRSSVASDQFRLESPDIGLGAEDLAKVIPSLTFTNSEGEVEGVKYERLNLLLINTIQEQQVQIEEQQERIAKQQEQIVQQQEQNRKVEERLAALEAVLSKAQMLRCLAFFSAFSVTVSVPAVHHTTRCVRMSNRSTTSVPTSKVSSTVMEGRGAQ
jgi:hypothetical protein